MTTAVRPGFHAPPCLPVLHLPEERAPKELAAAGSYRVLLATTDEERSAIFRLRFQVFNVELNEGLDHAYETGEDRDEFDDICELLYVQHKETGEVVGTYRAQTGTAAARNLGYYSEREFIFAPFEPMRAQILELGRACISQEHRSFEVLNLLWRGLANYSQMVGARYMIGCSSLTSQNPGDGWAVYEQLREHQADPELRTSATHAYYMPPAPPTAEAKAPRLLRAYLAVGAKICGTPALDREFKTIDFLTLLDLQAISTSAKARFLR